MSKSSGFGIGATCRDSHLQVIPANASTICLQGYGCLAVAHVVAERRNVRQDDDVTLFVRMHRWGSSPIHVIRSGLTLVRPPLQGWVRVRNEEMLLFQSSASRGASVM